MNTHPTLQEVIAAAEIVNAIALRLKETYGMDGLIPRHEAEELLTAAKKHQELFDAHFGN